MIAGIARFPFIASVDVIPDFQNVVHLFVRQAFTRFHVKEACRVIYISGSLLALRIRTRRYRLIPGSEFFYTFAAQPISSAYSRMLIPACRCLSYHHIPAENCKACGRAVNAHETDHKANLCALTQNSCPFLMKSTRLTCEIPFLFWRRKSVVIRYLG